MTHDIEADEWYGNCGACKMELFAPTKTMYALQYRRHTKSKDCLGGY
jgi:hypothetical protein